MAKCTQIGDYSISREQIIKHKCITLIFPICCTPLCYSAGGCYVLWTYSMLSLLFCALKQDTMNTYSQEHDADSDAAASLCQRESNEHYICGFLQEEIGRSFHYIQVFLNSDLSLSEFTFYSSSSFPQQLGCLLSGLVTMAHL